MSAATGWALLVLSGVLDVFWALATKKSNGMTHWGWGLLSILLLAAFVFSLARALSVLPLGMAYAVWTGIGAAGTVLAGMLLFAEPASANRLMWIAVIVIGIVGLNLSST